MNNITKGNNYLSAEKFGFDNQCSEKDNEPSIAQLEHIQKQAIEKFSNLDSSVQLKESEDKEFMDYYNETLLLEKVDFEEIKKDLDKLFYLGNTKIGDDTIIFNLQPARFCPSLANGKCKIAKRIDGDLKIACYAYQDERQYKMALQRRILQMKLWDTHTGDEIYSLLKRYYEDNEGAKKVYQKTDDKKKKFTRFKHPKIRYIRFNESGDLKDIHDAEKMDAIAEKALKELNLVSYTYTARWDIVNRYKFKYVQLQGSGFRAKTSKDEFGKMFKAFPSLYIQKGKGKGGFIKAGRKKGETYWEDIACPKIATEDEKIKNYDDKEVPFRKRNVCPLKGDPNPNYDVWSGTNRNGWFICPGNCSNCFACKSTAVKNIAIKIHRAFSIMVDEWYEEIKDVKEFQTVNPETGEPITLETPEEGYRIINKPVYDKDKNWTPEFEKDFEKRQDMIDRENNIKHLPRSEKTKFLLQRFDEIYSHLSVLTPDDEERIEDYYNEIKQWNGMVNNLAKGKTGERIILAPKIDKIKKKYGF